MGIKERKTERIVSQHLDHDSYKKVYVQFQKSDIPKINKLLRYASKKMDGGSSPDFIITFKEVPNLVIVIECKVSVSKHQSKELDRYSEYAVDGTLLYASYLSKEYDVLAIAVSGETKKELRVSHFIQIKGEPIAIKLDLDSQLLNYETYLDNYFKSHQKHRQEIESKKPKQKKQKGLSENNLIFKYEAGDFDLNKAVEQMLKPLNETKKAKKK